VNAAPKVSHQGGDKGVASKAQAPHVAPATGPANDVPVPQQIAQLQGIMDGLKHGQISVLASHNVIIVSTTIAVALFLSGLALVFYNMDTLETRLTDRMSRIEKSMSELPNQLLAIATAINTRQSATQQPTKK